VDTLISRAQFLRGDFSGQRTPVRPPWSIPETEFPSICNQCAQCITACPQHILEPGRGQYPQVNFDHGECILCAECVSHCTTGALSKSSAQQALSAWSIKAFIGDECLTQKNVLCQTCGELCEYDAIHFHSAKGGLSFPEISIENCSGCGACYAPCPTHAITLRAL
jgi:ferredoxin-type protein NapF